MPGHPIVKGLLKLFLVLLILLAGGLWFVANALPDTFYTTGLGKELRIASMP